MSRRSQDAARNRVLSVIHRLKPLCLLAFVSMSSAGAGTDQGATGPGVARVENAGLLFTDNPAGVSGTDAGYSIPIGKQTLWLFGDVFLLPPGDPAKRYLGAVSNCGLLVPAGTGPAPLRRYRFFTDAATGLARPLLQTEAGEGKEVRLWPFGAWYMPERREAYLFYSVVRVTGGGPFDFRVEGHGLACADVRNPAGLTFSRLKAPDGGSLWWRSGREPLFGAAAFGSPRDSYVYLIGDRSRGSGHTASLARVSRSRIQERAAYEYLISTEPRWGLNPAESIEIPGLTEFPGELSVSYNGFLGGYLAVYSVGISERLGLALAPQPWGPYRKIAEIGAPHRALSQAFCYAGKEHPELAEQGGKVIYITYVDSQRYWLQLYRVTLKR